jgi:GNAT superfamily N-acetyltransferase
LERRVLVVRELRDDELEAILPILAAMYADVPPAALRERLAEIRTSNWRCAAVLEDELIVGLAGYWVSTRFYCGRFLYVDHFYVRPERRSGGIGAALLEHLENRARAADCEIVCLDTFVGNDRAQRFWFRHGFRIVGFHFVQTLGG